jgi:hypothetical protein
MCYNKYVIKEGQLPKGSKTFLKKLKKPLDKGPAVWYNNRVAPREDLR